MCVMMIFVTVILNASYVDKYAVVVANKLATNWMQFTCLSAILHG